MSVNGVWSGDHSVATKTLKRFQTGWSFDPAHRVSGVFIWEQRDTAYRLMKDMPHRMDNSPDMLRLGEHGANFSGINANNGVHIT